MSLLVIAAGAILSFAVNVTTSGIDLRVVGWILIAVGALGLVLYVAIWERFRDPPRSPAPPRRRYPRDEAPTRRF